MCECSDINGAPELYVPAGVVCSTGALDDRTNGFSCLQLLISSSVGERDRCFLASAFRLLRRRQKKSKARNAARARAPSVQPRTIGSVSELPPPLPLAAGVAVADCAAFEATDEAIKPVGVEDVDVEVLAPDVEEAVDKLEVAAALADEVALEELAELELELELELVLVLELELDVEVESDEVLLEVVDTLELEVVELVLAMAEVTDEKIEPASDSSELNRLFCASAVAARKATNNGL